MFKPIRLTFHIAKNNHINVELVNMIHRDGVVYLNNFWLIFISVFLTNITNKWITAKLGFDYNIYQDGFNLLSVIVDFASFMLIYLIYYFIMKKLFVRD